MLITDRDWINPSEYSYMVLTDTQHDERLAPAIQPPPDPEPTRLNIRGKRIVGRKGP